MAEMKVPRGVSKHEVLDQIRAGTFDALHELMTTGSGSPGDNFYRAIQDGVREAVRATVTAGQLRLVTPDGAPGSNAAAAEAEAPKEGETPSA
jgi:hypothetical protein